MSTEHQPGRIFLSYRRTDAQHLAGRLFDRLEGRFGTGNVFMDVDSIEPGLDYGDVIDKAVGSCDVLMAVIGRNWLDTVDEFNRRRLDDPDDLIVLEIATALDRKIRVIPVLVEGAAPPRRDDLPEKLAPLARRQAVRLDHAGFNASMTTLLAALERALASTHTAADQRDAGGTNNDCQPSDNSSPNLLSSPEWTVDDFAQLLHDRRPSARRIVAVLDILTKQPDVHVALSDLAAAVGLSRSELRGAFGGLSYLCKRLRPDTELDWPIIWSHGTSTQPGQAQETWYHISTDVAERWNHVRRSPVQTSEHPSPAFPTAQAVAVSDASPSRGKSAAYAAFWILVIDHIRTAHPDWTNARKPSGQNWFAMPSPFRRETVYLLTFGRHHQLRSELYIDDTDPARVAAIYTALHEQKDRIEHVFGEPLRWDELPGRRASRIAAHTDAAGDILDTDLHDQYVTWFLGTQERLRAALNHVLPKVQADLESMPP